MSLTIKERIEREKQRRETANARMREKVAAARKRGKCRWSVDKYGDRGAWRLATSQRQDWEKSM